MDATEATALLQEIYDETEDWEDALSGERPSLTELRKRIHDALSRDT